MSKPGEPIDSAANPAVHSKFQVKVPGETGGLSGYKIQQNSGKSAESASQSEKQNINFTSSKYDENKEEENQAEDPQQQ